MSTMTMSELVHESAQIDPLAEIGPDVEIGPFATIEGPVRIGEGCRIGAHASLRGPLSMGVGNSVGSHAVIGTDPQSTSFKGESSRLEIGDDNVFESFSTVHRGTEAGGGVTRIGHRNWFLSGAHVGHDVQVGDDCRLGMNSLLAGHVVVGDGCSLGSHTAVQQRVRLGRLSRLVGPGASTKDVPPFFVLEGYNAIVGVNLDLLSRAGLSLATIDALKGAYRLLYKAGSTFSAALCRIESEFGRVTEVAELLDFIRRSSLGIGMGRDDARRHYYS